MPCVIIVLKDVNLLLHEASKDPSCTARFLSHLTTRFLLISRTLFQHIRLTLPND